MNVERIFSLMGSQWTKERNRLKVGTVKSILIVAYNFKDFSCKKFYDTFLNEEKYLNQIRSAQKYDTSDEEEN